MTDRNAATGDELRLRQAEEELRQLKERGKNMTPILDKLRRHLTDNMFLERFILAVEKDKRRP